jgi:hypothetical protein
VSMRRSASDRNDNYEQQRHHAASRRTTSQLAVQSRTQHVINGQLVGQR